ncbi:MFS transporter, partial [Aciditerrimonas ferrireducens]
MTDTALAQPAERRSSSPLSFLWRRQLDHYPETAPRIFFLGIVVVATIVLYYELYVQGAVAPSIIAQYHMSFMFYVDISVVGNALGAFASLIAGLADRWGRANLVTYGLVVTGLLVLVGLPNASSEWTYAVMFGAVSFVEGIILVATPALVRDFSPQLGRASAMGFWTLGPVMGSLVVAEVASHTLAAGATPPWQGQFHICGVVGLVVAAIAILGLRELSPALRDQLMVSMRDRALIEARAKGLDISESLKRPWRQMLHLDIIGSAFAISVFL